MPVTGLEPVSALGIFLEIIGFIMLLTHEKGTFREIQERMNPLGPSPTNFKFRVVVFLRWSIRKIGIYFIIFGLFLQLVSLLD